MFEIVLPLRKYNLKPFKIYEEEPYRNGW